ncbi:MULTISPECIES: TIGR03618 family F420-dependent PPOX class oxidoreductase [Streptosporangium]|uniref:PPOX class probable F420-dependent enzyme n=1 Tax=Streptosporangium brasiliense TaxID=47480 RepID=A0ABT9RHA6_9ACTN|nr:TIGR03618 family F420-dependent PPOX class oxidoreductase [Streptosporangium brasiliense]MDP9867755.1 PPOX class probable F420-dependent enzyme [Streptosporangium brasiliense]
MGKLNDDAKQLLGQPIHGWVTTVRPDGSLHSTVVWVDVDGDDVIFNTAVGRAKERHLRGNPQVSVSVLDPKDAFHLVSISGTAELELEGADEVIDGLAGKYLGVESYPYRQPGEQRITVRVKPDQVIYSPGS